MIIPNFFWEETVGNGAQISSLLAIAEQIAAGELPPDTGQRREDVRTLVDAGFNVAWAGDGDKPQGVASIPWTHPDYLPALMSRAAVTLCVDLRHDVAGYWSDRLWLALGAGACVVRRFTEGQPGLPYLSYTHRQ